MQHIIVVCLDALPMCPENFNGRLIAKYVATLIFLTKINWVGSLCLQIN